MKNITITLIRKLNDSVEKYQLKEHVVFLVKNDGMELYSTHPQTTRKITALVAGAWQASSYLAKDLIDNYELEKSGDSFFQEFRFSFDRSDCGVYLLPLMFNNGVQILGIVYKNVINPAQIKSYFKKTQIELQNLVDQESQETQEIKKKSPKLNRKQVHHCGEFLFDDISDAEMDRLFSFVEKK